MNDSLPTLTITNSWQELLRGAGRAGLEQVLPAYVQPRRWFGAKARQITAAQIVETIFVIAGAAGAALNMVRITYAEGQADTYVMPLAFAPTPRAEQLARELPHAVVARVQVAGAAAGVLYDPLVDADFCAALLELIASQGRLPGVTGELQASTTSAFARLRNPDGGSADALLTPQIVTAEQSNSSIIYGDRFILKLFRRLEIGLNPDLEIGRFLTERSHFSHVPPAAGALEYHAAGGEPSSLGFFRALCETRATPGTTPSRRWLARLCRWPKRRPTAQRSDLLHCWNSQRSRRLHWRAPSSVVTWNRRSCWASALPSCTSRCPATPTTRTSRPSHLPPPTSARSMTRCVAVPANRLRVCGACLRPARCPIPPALVLSGCLA